jgi:hypothetical protein
MANLNTLRPQSVTLTGNISAGNIVGNGSQLTNITGANIAGNVTSATTAYNGNVSTVSNNQEYRPLLATNTTGNLSFKASAGISWNPSTYGLTAGKILLGGGIGAQGVTGVYAYGANTAWQVQSQNGTGTDAAGQEIGRFGSEYTSGATTYWDSYISYYQGSGSNSGWLNINAAGSTVANVASTGISVTGTVSATGNVTAGNIIANGTTANIFNTTATTVNAFGAATALTLGYSGTSGSTHNVGTGAVASGSTKTINIGTAGVSGSTTSVAIGSAVSGSTTNLTFNGVVADATALNTAASVGYLGMPQNSKSASYTLLIGDIGKHIYVTATGQTITIPANSSVAYPIGTTVTFIAGPSATTVSIAITTDTMYLAGSSNTTGTRTLAAYGMATAIKVAATTWYINGSGLT